MKKLCLFCMIFLLIPLTLLAERDWTILAQYPIPESSSGLAWDGTYLYSGIYGSNGGNVYRIDPSDGSYQLQFTGTQGDTYGMTYDGTYLVICDHQSGTTTPAIAMKYDLIGNFISQFNLVDHYMSGIAYDDGNYWCATYYDPDGWIYKISESGTILSNFAAPDNQPWDLCIEHGNLWMADYWGDALYAIDPNTGTLMETHATEHEDPSGVVYDGQYLWYCDNGSDYNNDWLYKVDLGGAGTPVINIPNTNYPFGTVTLGDSATWNCYVYSSGTGDLEVTDVTLSGLNASDVHFTVTLPQTITPSNNMVIPFVYLPDEASALNCTATVYSNDPISSEVDVIMTGDAVNPGPSIHVLSSTHNYGTVRANSLSRWYLEVQNIGDETLTITDAYASDPHFYVDDDVTFPINLSPLEIIQMGIWFTPAAGVYYSETISIDSNDPSSPCTEVAVAGEGNTIDYPIGDQLWYYYISTGWDNSIKAIASIPDINGDDIADVIVSSEDYYYRCFNGNSTGLADVLWEIEIPSGCLSYQHELTITKDLNSDGYYDFIVGTPWGDRSIHAISGKTGTIIWTHDTHEYGDGGWVYQVDTGFDYNGDGLVDVIAATGDDGDTHTGPQRVYCLDGNDGSSLWEFYQPGPKFSAIGIDDVNGDNIPDAIGGGSDRNEDYGYVYGINGVNGTLLWTFSVSGSSVWALGRLDDINGDGINDIVAGDFYGSFYYIDPTDGSEIHSGSMGSCILLDVEIMDDVNDDFYKDAIFESSSTNSRMLNGYSAATIWNISLSDKAWNIARIDDITGDYVNDVIVGTLYSNNYCYFMNGVNGDILDSFNYGQAIDGINAIPDIVGDGSMEMVVGGREGTLTCYSGGLDAPVSIDDEPSMTNTLIAQNFPNPFSGCTTISFSKPTGRTTPSKIKIYNVIGQLVAQTELEPLQNSFTWDGRDQRGSTVSSGVYFYKIQSGSYSATNKMIYMK